MFVGEPKANQFLETSSDHEEIPGLLLLVAREVGGAKRGGKKKKQNKTKKLTTIVAYNGKLKISVSNKKKKKKKTYNPSWLQWQVQDFSVKNKIKIKNKLQP